MGARGRWSSTADRERREAPTCESTPTRRPCQGECRPRAREATFSSLTMKGVILDILYELLHDDEGYEVVAAESGDEALRAPTEPAPALILMDVRLLGEDSEPIARALRARPGWDAAALIVCSGIDRYRRRGASTGGSGPSREAVRRGQRARPCQRVRVGPGKSGCART